MRTSRWRLTVDELTALGIDPAIGAVQDEACDEEVGLRSLVARGILSIENDQLHIDDSVNGLLAVLREPRSAVLLTVGRREGLVGLARLFFGGGQCVIVEPVRARGVYELSFTSPDRAAVLALARPADAVGASGDRAVLTMETLLATDPTAEARALQALCPGEDGLPTVEALGWLESATGPYLIEDSGRTEARLVPVDTEELAKSIHEALTPVLDAMG